MSLMIEALPESGSPENVVVSPDTSPLKDSADPGFFGGLKAICSLLIVVGFLGTVVIARVCYICDSFLYVCSY